MEMVVADGDDVDEYFKFVVNDFEWTVDVPDGIRHSLAYTLNPDLPLLNSSNGTFSVTNGTFSVLNAVVFFRCVQVVLCRVT